MSGCKYVFVLGGVISGGGKGLTAASIGLLLSMRGLKVQPLKCDPYLNGNAGILAPREHGEVFLCDDGSETDLDLGHYERIIGCNVSRSNIVTQGTIYRELFEDEDEGKYLGNTIQVIPHVTDKITDRFKQLSKDTDIVIVEIGGTVGDIESRPFLEAVRQFKTKNWSDVLIVMVSPILWIETIQELKTKPLQQSVQNLQGFGIHPDIILARLLNLQKPLSDKETSKLLDKISNLTGVDRRSVFDAPDVKSVWQVPIEFHDRHIDDLIMDKFRIERNGIRIHKYRDLVERYMNADDMTEVRIGVVGKYDNCQEAYLSLKEAIQHAGVSNKVNVKILWMKAERFENDMDWDGDLDGMIVPGGFDVRGVEGKIKAIQFCRNAKIPFLGICLGLQCAVIEYARNLCGLEDANSTEFSSECAHPVVHFVEGQEKLRKKSGTMRLGAYDCELVKDSLAHELYKKKLVSERHRHRYEVNSVYVDQLQAQGLKVSGRNPQTGLVEIMELDKSVHPFYVCTQAHPEFKSRLGTPSPLFHGLIAAAKKKTEEKNEA